MPFPNSSSQVIKKDFNSRVLALFFAIAGAIFTAISYLPISLVFKGEYKLNQKIDIFKNVFIDFDQLKIAFLSDLLKLDRQIPVGTISVRFYAICILLGVLAGYFLALYLARSQYIAGTIIDRLIIGLIIFGLLGARLFYVAFKWDYFGQNPQAIFGEILSGGLAIFGTLIFCGIYLWLYCYRYKFNFYEFADLIAPALLLGQVIGRFGNFFNYEGYGDETSVYWKMYVPASANYYSELNAEYFHPTFLYEIIPNFLLFIFLLFNYSKFTEKRAGLIFGWYAAGYGIIRFVTEFFRLDALRLYLPTFLQFKIEPLGKIEYLFASQIMAVILVVTGVVVLWTRRKVIYIKKNMQEFKTA
jgi:phosphatidylglycerol:prolipoprotein diacylglycerol transferase